MKLTRMVIHPKDIQLITGKSERYGRLLLRKIKEHFRKEEHQLVSINEFCLYTGLEIEHVEKYLST